MTEFRNPIPLPHIPDDLTIPQFMLREITGRPRRPRNVPFFIEDATGRAIGYEEAHHRTYSIANALSLKWKIGRGDVVCVFSPNHIDYAPVVWAVHVLGGIVTPSNPSYTVEELKYQLDATKAKLIVAHPLCFSTALSAADATHLSGTNSIVLFDPLPGESLPTLNELVEFGARRPENYCAVRFKPGEARSTVALLSFSSGTTGKPKAVAISHYSVIANVIQMATHYNVNDPNNPSKTLSPGDVAIAVLPFFHIYGLVVTMHFLLFASLTLVVVPKFNLDDYLRSIVQHSVTHLFVVPPQVVLLCKHPEVRKYDLSRVKFCFSGAAPLGGELMQQLTKILPNAVIGQGYGLTETCTTISMVPPNVKLGRIGSAGQILPGITARVVKEDGSLASEGEVGELVVTGPSMSLGYLNNPKATAETYVDGWVRTGDEVVIKDNEVYVEIMKVRGFQVAPAELEAHLLLHPDVADACVVPKADEYSGEVPLAYVVLSRPATERIGNNPRKAEDLKKAIAKHVADVKVPYKRLAGGVEFIDAIPKNPSGKILRRILREKAKTLPSKRALLSRL
ncbi:AMP dependent CoA ligase [Coprinopsis cinerea okayama7|uniref:AMP dependent CoA ligase n=1 Tax=Coprinopsis cinerea (strain Okayama-7 / 130 / ATCC MYA-4618 / FGSC 9003) TaxID=240176 RepID=A8N2D5_COPC7|nr:AMP dependent CoA ligase [Coprinopsis cinerea okayama7\|eukprot:XP_001829094.2 AMP dependent CoA ligase [Coprinopsis cinerea okayama7\